MSIELRATHQHPAAEGSHFDVGRAFLTLKGVDVELYVVPPHDAQGITRITMRARDPASMRQADERVRLKALYARRYTVAGADKVHWLEIGRGLLHAQGVDLDLTYLPPPDAECRMRFILRPLDQPAVARTPGAPQAAQQPGYGAPSPQTGTQPGYRPQHRDGLGQGGQQSLGEQPQRPPYNDPDENLPF